MRPFSQRALYVALRQVCRLIGVVYFGTRCSGRENFPESGGALVCANHQSHLDPPLVGMIANRRMNYLAKKELFLRQPLKWVIEHLDAIPIDRSGMGLSGIRETMKRLRRGEMVLIFPEGQRTLDGEMNHLMPGFCALARRTGVPLVPVGLDGAFQSFPRGSHFPRPGNVWIVVGKPLRQSEYENLSDREMIDLLESRIRDCFESAQRSLPSGSGFANVASRT